MSPITDQQLFEEMAATCRAAGISAFEIEIVESVTQEHKRSSRRYAQMYIREDGVPVFEFADQTRWLDYRHRLGLYTHEIGHALHPGSEDDADAAGMYALGVLIVYDHAWPGKGLQTAVW